MKELEFQKVVIKYIRYFYPKLFVFAVRNEGKRTAYEQSIIKSMGLVSGVSDLIILYNSKSLFVELKVGKNNLTENQKIFKENVESRGFEYLVVRDLSELEKNLKEWLNCI